MTISVSNLGKRFNREWIFKGLTQEFQAGNTYAILGPNGSGKSTLMRVLWGQEQPSQGEMLFLNGTDPVSLEDIYSYVSIVAPYMDLIDELTLTEQIEFHFKFKKVIQGLRMDSILARLDLEYAREKSISQFSSGMRQRLKLGLCFLSETSVAFLDEPTTNLDQAAVAWYFDNLLQIESKRLVFIATNQRSDLPVRCKELNLSNLKGVTNRSSAGIQNGA